MLPTASLRYFYGCERQLRVYYTVLSPLFNSAVRESDIFISWNNVSYQLLLWLWCRENSPPWILNIELILRSYFYLCGHKENQPSISISQHTLPCLSKSIMLQLAWLQGHKYTAPPSVTSGWLVLAFGAPIKMRILDSRKENKTLLCGKELNPGKVWHYTKELLLSSKIIWIELVL